MGSDLLGRREARAESRNGPPMGHSFRDRCRPSVGRVFGELAQLKHLKREQPPRLQGERFHPFESVHRPQGLVSTLSRPFTLRADITGPWPDRRAGTEMKQWRRSGPSWKPGYLRSTGV